MQQKQNMTRQFKFSILLLIAACSIHAYTLYAENVSGSDEDEIRILCKCQDGLFSNNKCLASNSGDLCAQSEKGGNINCRDYSSNCK